MLFQLEKVRYQNVLDIDHLTIPEDTVCCVHGESGAGKSTLLKLLNHLISPDHGQVIYRGQDIAGMDPIKLRQKVVMLAQQPTMFPGDVGENLLIGCKFANLQVVSEPRLKEMLAFLDLNKDLASSVEKLSGGEKQRLALGRVLLMEPEVLLLDEPSASLDEDSEATLVKQVVEYCKEKEIALLMVTHAKSLVEQYGEYRVALSNGQVVKEEI